jgi:hypothetical protein
MSFIPQEWYSVKYGLGDFREGIVTNNDLHEKGCSQLLTQMSMCIILLNHNLWFRIEGIKMKQGLLQYLINHKKSQVHSR